MAIPFTPKVCASCDETIALAEKYVQYGRKFVHETCDKKARNGRTRARIIDLLLQTHDGVRPILVIPRGGRPYFTRRG